jgi:predicted site-specific integrase-resolvase
MTRDNVAPGAGEQIFMRQKDVAELLGVSERSLERWRLEGRGPVYRKWAGGRLVSYARNDVLAWADAQRRTSTSDPGPGF